MKLIAILYHVLSLIQPYHILGELDADFIFLMGARIMEQLDQWYHTECIGNYTVSHLVENHTVSVGVCAVKHVVG